MTPTKELEIQRTTAPALEPAVDVLERNGDIVLMIDLPGCTESDVEVTIEKESIQIEATPHAIPDVENARHYREFVPARFARSFSLSREADRDAIGATLDQGVLRLDIPRTVAGQSRKIEVRPRAN